MSGGNKLLINLLLLIVFFFPPHAFAKKIIIVRNPRIAPFNEAIDGVCQVLSKSEYRETTVDVYDIDSKNYISLIESGDYDIICTAGSMISKEIKEFVQDKPVVFMMILNPIQSGIVDTMGPSGTNITGSALDIPPQMQLSLLKEIVPTARVIGVISGLDALEAVRQAKLAQDQLDLIITPVMVSATTDVPEVLRKMINRGNIDTLWLVPDTTVCTPETLPIIINFCMERKVPLMGFAPYLAKAGALVCYTLDYNDIGRQAGELIIRILNGEDPGVMPITVPRRVKYVLNAKTARYLGLRIPLGVIDGADEVFD